MVSRRRDMNPASKGRQISMLRITSFATRRGSEACMTNYGCCDWDCQSFIGARSLSSRFPAHTPRASPTTPSPSHGALSQFSKRTPRCYSGAANIVKYKSACEPSMLATNITYAARSEDYSGIGPLDLLSYRPGQYQLTPVFQFRTVVS